MNRGSCVNCGELLPPWSRADRLTCSVRCRVARQRRASAADPGPGVLRVRTAGHPVATAITAVTSEPTGSTLEDVLAGVTDEGAELRLSAWLADVSAESALDTGDEPVPG